MDTPKKTPPKNPDSNNIKDENTPTRRVRFLMVNPADFLMLFTQGLTLAKRTKVITGVPDDAKLQSMTVDHVRGGIILVVQSDSYEEIPLTDMPPVQHVEIEIGLPGATKPAKKKRK